MLDEDSYNESLFDTDKPFCRIILDVLSAHGVKDVVCSPGSRNTPLLIAAAAREHLHKHVVADERSAAFMALGIAMTSRKPVALICTSGTALLNYAPAVAEAFYSSIPLVVISADRPAQWIDQDDSQTIHQAGALDNIVKKSYHIDASDDDRDEMAWYVNRLVNDAMTEALSRRRGPVHINLPLTPPLGRKVKISREAVRKITLLKSEETMQRDEMKRLAEYAAGKRVLLIAGFMPPDDALNKAVAELMQLSNVVVLAETISNLHLEGRTWNIDTLLSSLDDEKRRALRPELIISLGGSLVSRMVKEYLRDCKDAENWAVGYSHTTVDCFMNLSLRIETDRARFIRALARLMKRKVSCRSDYARIWNETAHRSMLSHTRFIENAPWSEMTALKGVFEYLPQNANLHLSNGTPVRYAQLLLDRMPHACYCNRGVSGIDGCTSTAIGSALAYKGTTVLISGDLSFAYDIGALNIRETPASMKIIVIKNGGGGIFRFIGSTSSLDEREKYFCADPDLPVKSLALAYGWLYFHIENEKDLTAALPSFYSSPDKAIMEIVCDGELSADILKAYMKRDLK